MDEALERRINQFKLHKSEECFEEVMQLAIAIVDSSFRVDPLIIQIDSTGRPPVPAKPTIPNFQVPSDSVRLAPLINPTG